MGILKGGTDLPDSGRELLPEEQQAVLDKLAHQVVKRGMTVPAIIFLESIKPLNFIASQAMVFFEPIIQTIFDFRDYDNLRLALERRESLEILLCKIEELDAVALDREKRIKKYMKEQRKHWKWYQRYLRIFTPKVKIPDEVLNPPEDGSSAGTKPEEQK
jgi:hypothetical protein